MLIIAGHTEVDPDYRDEAVAVMRRLFGVLPLRIELETVQVIGTPEATHVRHRIRRRTDERTT
jgi:hypothetical protein